MRAGENSLKRRKRFKIMEKNKLWQKWQTYKPNQTYYYSFTEDQLREFCKDTVNFFYDVDIDLDEDKKNLKVARQLFCFLNYILKINADEIKGE